MPARATRRTASAPAGESAAVTARAAGMKPPKITGIQVDEFSYTLNNMATDYNGFNLVYEPGGKATASGYAIRITTDIGITGECIGWGNVEPVPIRMFAHYLMGKNALERERIYSDVKRALRQVARMGLAP
ncbi:MAG: hypothetical protein V1724_00255, partial [Chloroflexota bacterium]